MFRPVKIRHYIRAMAARGFSAADVLRDSGIREADLKDPSFLTDLPQCRAVVSNMIELTGNQGIGFEIGNEAEFVDLGIVGHAILSSRNIRDAVILWTRYSSALIGMMVEFSVDERCPDDWSLHITESIPMGFLYNFCVEELLTLMFRLGGALSDQRASVRSLELSYPSPSHQALYVDQLHVTPHFNAGETVISFSDPNLDSPLRGSDAEFNAICLQHCSQIMRQIASHSDIVARLRNLLLAKPGAIPDLEDAASRLGMSTRTLRRRLTVEGHSYHRLVDTFRFDLAREYLKSSHITAKEVGYLVGFNDADAFRRAFKKWAGETVGEYQRRTQQ